MRASARLQKEIELLEEKQRQDFSLIKDDLNDVLAYVQPVNIIKRTLKDAANSPEIRDDVFKIGLNLATTLLTNKVFAGTSNSAIKNSIMGFMNTTVKDYVSKNSGSIKTGAKNFALKLLNKVIKSPSQSNEDPGLTPANEPA